MKVSILYYLPLLLLLASCVTEEAPEKKCDKIWEVEINNPEAKVDVREGKLIVDIPYPKTATEVRLIQRQNPEVNRPDIGIGIKLSAFDAVPVNEASGDSQLRAGFAYSNAPENLFLTVSTGGGYSIYGKTDKAEYKEFNVGQLTVFAQGEVAEYNKYRNSIETSTISAASKICYIDFGVNPARTGTNPTKAYHAEIDFVAFGDYVNRDLVLVNGYNKEEIGFKVDEFSCNSLKN